VWPPSAQQRDYDPRRQLPLEGKTPQRPSAKAHCSRNKIGEKSVSAARSTASRSLATALFEGALARGLLQIGKHQGVSSSCRPGANSGCRLTAASGFGWQRKSESGDRRL